MGIAKRLLTLALALVMLVSTCVIVSATLPSTPTSTFSGVSHYRYWNAGPNSGKSTTYQVLKFNPASSGVIPLAYSGDVGKTASVAQHVAAAQADGYEVLGAINGSFFSMSTGDPCPALISGGRLMFATATREEVFTAFDINGTPNLIQTTLLYDLTLNGTKLSNAIGLVNKDYTAVNDISATISTRFHYYDSVAGAIGNSAQTGYEILCEKINGTDIKVGKTLEGKVISVTSGYYGKTIPTNKNQFVLFVKSSSSYASYATSLSAGKLISLKIYSANDWANSILSNAYSAICDTYWLVKDGSNIAASQSEIGHSTTLSRPWTAFGWDNNGNIYYMITEGELATLRDVAAEMIKMGCTNVVRLDGGGSTAMWVNGSSTYQQGRLVTDALLIVKRPEDHRLNLEQTLKEAKALYQGDYSAEANNYINQAYDKAFDVHKNSASTNDALKKANTDLKNAIAYIKNASNFPGKAKLTKFLYVDDFDKSVPTGGCVILTPDFNGGNLTTANAGYGYSYGVLAEKVTGNTYKVVQRYEKYKGDITLKSNQILLMTSYQKTKPVSELNRDNMLKLAIGEILTFRGMDITYKYISAGAYVDAAFSYVETEPDPEPKPDPDPDPDPDPKPVEGVIGDVNANGKIDARDYLLLKRAYFGTYELTCDDAIADINGNGKIDARDYLLLKRAYFGTYTIE